MNFKPHDPRTAPGMLIITVWIDGNNIRGSKANGSTCCIALQSPNPTNVNLRGDFIFVDFHGGKSKFTDVYTLTGDRRGRIVSV